MNFKYIRAMVLAAAAAFPFASQAAPVDLELVLAVDASGSVDGNEYAGQKNGYIAAFNSTTVQNAIMNGARGRIAVTYVEWSGSTQQTQLVNWTVIDSAASASAFATAIDNTSRIYSGSTAIGAAIDFSTGLFSFNQTEPSFTGDRMVIDISGDGENNDGVQPSTARDNALTAGVTAINGIAIGSTSLEQYYRDNVIGGTNAFATFAADFEADFSAAISDKLVREITAEPVPVPATFGLLGLGLAGLAMVRRRKQAV